MSFTDAVLKDLDYDESGFRRERHFPNKHEALRDFTRKIRISLRPKIILALFLCDSENFFPGFFFLAA
jgi:hypothetical protein